jgi:hypothetical protein
MKGEVVVNFKLKVIVDEESPVNDPYGYFSVRFMDRVYGDQEVYTRLGLIEDQLQKFINSKNKLYHDFFDGKSDLEIFNLIYKLTQDWDYFESVPREQTDLNNLFFYNNSWITEESMDSEMIYVIFKDGHYKFLCKYIEKGCDMYSQPFFSHVIEQHEFEQEVFEFRKKIGSAGRP